MADHPQDVRPAGEGWQRSFYLHPTEIPADVGAVEVYVAGWKKPRQLIVGDMSGAICGAWWRPVRG